MLFRQHGWYGIDVIFNITNDVLSIMTCEYWEESTSSYAYNINLYTGEEVSNNYEEEIENLLNELRLATGNKNITIYNEKYSLNLIVRVWRDSYPVTEIITIAK